MLETLSSQPAGGSVGVGAGAGPLSPRRGRGRRESKVAYRNHSGFSSAQRNNAPAYSNSPRQSNPQITGNEHSHHQFHGQVIHNLDYLSYFDVHRFSTGYSNTSPVVHQHLEETSWLSLSPSNSYTLATPKLPGSPQQQDHVENHGQSPSSDMPQLSAQETAWNITTPRTSTIGSEMDDMSDFHSGSVGNFESNSTAISAANTAMSSISDTYVFPMNPLYDLSGNQLNDLELPDGFHGVGAPFDTSSPGTANPTSPLDFTFDNEFPPVSPNQYYGDTIYGTDVAQWSATTLAPPDQALQHQMHANSAVFQSSVPWSSQTAQNDANVGGATFEPIRGIPYHIHVARQGFLETGRTSPRFFGPDPVSPTSDFDGSWAVISYPPSIDTASHGSPVSHSSPISHSSPVSHNSPKPHESPPSYQDVETTHSHVFQSLPDPPKAKGTRGGRQRGLTAVEKQQARDVREAKACWACHISKTKCSPCSPGKPCEQCARLAGKRRFCLFSCFNDPLESLTTFMVPTYLTGHFTQANVESFVARNASSWGTQSMSIRMDWGYREFLEADVVELGLRSSSSEMGFHHQTISTGHGRPILVRKQSPPLGIPLAAMEEMQDSYSRYVREIVQSDVGDFVPVAYIDRRTDLPMHLLGAVASYYSAGNAGNNESELLRRALEMHVTSVILRRSLILSRESLRRVQDQLQQEFPERSAPRCAQRQIKLAFFLLQQRRIRTILKDWGSMMWSTNQNTPKDKEWAIAFSVFLTLILVMNETINAAYEFCEGRIKYRGQQPSTERDAFQELVQLTQREVFDRCKEIFHWKFKTRKGGKEACNPIRDGIEAFQGKSKLVDPDVIDFVRELRKVVSYHETEVRSHRTVDGEEDSEYTDTGRLACIFLDDFLSH